MRDGRSTTEQEQRARPLRFEIVRQGVSVVFLGVPASLRPCVPASLRAVSRSPARERSKLSREAVGPIGCVLIDVGPETAPLTPAERLPAQVTHSIMAMPVGRPGRKRRVGLLRYGEGDAGPFFPALACARSRSHKAPDRTRRKAVGERMLVSGPPPQNCFGSPASRRMPLAVCLDLILVGTVNGRSLWGLVQIS